MQKIDGEKFTIVLPDDLKKQIERIATRQGWTRAKTMRTLMESGVDVYETFEAFGVVKLTEVVKRAHKAVESSLEPPRLFAKK